jgi:D-alanine--poly(phosphoribitol) ligase subunit 1
MDLIAEIDRWGRQYPDRPAHISGGQVLTYGDLAGQSRRLANHLSASLPEDRTPVAISGHKQNEMLVAFIGCIRSGHPYIPLDASLPPGRVKKIVEAAQASLLTSDQVRTILAAEQSQTRMNVPNIEAGDLWYVIFTSGSTGDPKGVMITRGCLESFLEWTLHEQGFKEAGETFLNQAPFSFDLSVMDLYASLATAGTLFSITQDEIVEPRRLFEALSRSNLSVWVSTPSFARFCLMQPSFARAMLPRVHKFWFCGETLAPEIAAELLRRFPEAEVWNTYGPTEATVATTSIRITGTVISQYNPLPVGRAKPGTRVLIYDENSTPVTGRQRGQIVIAGPNVGLGYIRRPDLTERSFFELDGERAYRTGDWGHFEDGVLFFEGRMDFQIKLHGYRIEIGDIESNLHRLESVRDAVVIPAMRDDRADYLVAFTILKSAPQTSEFEMAQTLRHQLGERLPDYMVPRKFVFLNEFPTTANGKVDRKQLARILP